MWKEIDFNDNIIRIEPERMKMKRTHLVPMSKQVSSMLLSIKTNNDFVFISPRGKSRHITPESLRAGLRRLGLTNDDITTHGFRHMASTRLNELGFKSDVIERQLAHCETNKVKAAYNHAEYLQERIEMMQRWSDYLDKLKESGMTQELIIP
jgi:integrase